MLRFISLLSIIIVIWFLFWTFFSREHQEEFLVDGQNFEAFVESALERNTPEADLYSVQYSLDEFFSVESEIYQNNMKQIALRNTLSESFQQAIHWERELYSTNLTQTQIEEQLRKERNLQDWNQRPLWNTRTNTQRTQQSWGSWWGCTGLIFDPCIVLWEDDRYIGAMDFWMWRSI